MHTISTPFDVVFLSLQTIVVLFLLLHDWINLGSLNNLAAVHSQDTLGRRIYVTLLPALPAGIGLFFSARHFAQPYPDWLEMMLWILYSVLILGMLRAWWIPYLVLPDPERAARYQVMFAGTHRFLPQHNGMAPDTLHTVFHLVTFATVAGLWLRGRL
jgi:hypothetical protein